MTLFAISVAFLLLAAGGLGVAVRSARRSQQTLRRYRLIISAQAARLNEIEIENHRLTCRLAPPARALRSPRTVFKRCTPLLRTPA